MIWNFDKFFKSTWAINVQNILNFRETMYITRASAIARENLPDFGSRWSVK